MQLWRRPLDADLVVAPRGRVVILEERCKGCAFCVDFCPRDTLAMSAKFNAKGYHPPEVVDGVLCVDCKLCELLCPEFAIYSLDARADETPEIQEAGA